MQALELVLADGEIGSGGGDDGREGLRIVGGELREYGIAGAEELAGAGEVGDVSMDLAGEHRVVRHAVHLGTLDFGIPVGALDEAQHDAAVVSAREVDDPVDHERAALAVGLDNEADAVPAGQRGVGRKRFQDVERQFQAVGFLGVDVQADVVALCQQREAPDVGQQFVHDPFALGAAVARVQGGQLDGDARPRVDAASAGGLADGMHGGFVFA